MTDKYESWMRRLEERERGDAEHGPLGILRENLPAEVFEFNERRYEGQAIGAYYFAEYILNRMAEERPPLPAVEWMRALLADFKDDLVRDGYEFESSVLDSNRSKIFPPSLRAAGDPFWQRRVQVVFDRAKAVRAGVDVTKEFAEPIADILRGPRPRR